jgi:hypothetical protein
MFSRPCAKMERIQVIPQVRISPIYFVQTDFGKDLTTLANFGNALQAASHGGHEKIVELSKGADINFPFLPDSVVFCLFFTRSPSFHISLRSALRAW